MPDDPRLSRRPLHSQAARPFVLSPWLRRGALVFVLILMTGGLLLWANPSAGDSASQPANILPLLTIFGVLLVCSGLVSSSETALFSLDKLDLTQMRTSLRLSERAVVRLLDRPNETLITILILNNLINIAASLMAGVLMEQWLGGVSPMGFTLAAATATVGILLVGEIWPKLLAHGHRHLVSRTLALPLATVNWLMWPLRLVMHGALTGIFALLHIPIPNGGEEVSDEELKAMINSGEVAQVLEDDEREMIDGVFELHRQVAAEIMTPRTAVDHVPDSLDQAEMIDHLRHSRHNRVLVYRQSLDELVGFLLVKEVLLDPQSPWQEHVREPLCVPEGVGLLDLLKTFRRERTKIAVVVDEYGGVAGVVTLQDLLEEIVGDIYEKHEKVEQEILELEAEHWRVTGSVSLSELSDLLGERFPEDKGRTVGGFVMNTLGQIPHVGDQVQHQAFVLRVAEMAGRRVHAVEIARMADAAATGNGRGGDPS